MKQRSKDEEGQLLDTRGDTKDIDFYIAEVYIHTPVLEEGVVFRNSKFGETFHPIHFVVQFLQSQKVKGSTYITNLEKEEPK